MHRRGNRRVGLVGWCLFGLILLAGAAALAAGVLAIRKEWGSGKGNQAMPAQAAEQSGATPAAAPR